MKKIFVLLLVFGVLPSLTVLAASTTSRNFVVRNWKAAPPASATLAPTTPVATSLPPTDEVEAEEVESMGSEEPLTPVDDQIVPPAPITPDEVAQNGQDGVEEDYHTDEPDAVQPAAVDITSEEDIVIDVEVEDYFSAEFSPRL